MKNDKVRELFTAALEDSRVASSDRPKDMTELEIVEAETIEEMKSWDEIAEMMDGPLAARFLRELNGLSGREFVKTYLRMLEYVKPKLVRVSDDKKDDKDNTIRVEIYKMEHEQ